MARKIQTQSTGLESGTKTGTKAFIGLLANAIFWLVMAVVLPIRAIMDAFPELAPYVHWAPILFYMLALLSFVRAVRALSRVATRRLGQSGRQKPADQMRPQRPSSAGPVKSQTGKSQTGPPVNRPPTVQRMR